MPGTTWRRLVLAVVTGAFLLLATAGACDNAEAPGTTQDAPGGY